ncbi:uncharacterized protein TrAtP1_003079 [Trichoderma atroviride]|nr:hypothetical protein TrAtP1_003079 [Trichoderma atroviride]
MKTTTLLAAASVAGVVAAQSLSDYFPKCSVDCLEEATKQATSCSTTDAVCFCVQSNYEAIYNSGLACVLKDCGNDVAVDKVLPAAIQFCSAASSSASAAATATAAGESTSTTAATTPKTTHATQTTETAETTAPQTTSSALPTTTGAVSSNTAASGRPASTTRATTSLSTAAAGAAKPLVTAAMIIAGAVAMI